MFDVVHLFYGSMHPLNSEGIFFFTYIVRCGLTINKYYKYYYVDANVNVVIYLDIYTERFCKYLFI